MAPPGNDPAPRRHPPPVDYEPWPQRRRLPRVLKVLIWVAVGVHALGIIPAVIFLGHALMQDHGTLNEVVSSGTCCCYPAIAVVLVACLFFWIRAGEDRT
jgi:hypothetical protein